MSTILTLEQRAEYQRDGCIIVRGLFDAEETRLLREAMEKDPAITAHFYDRHDATGAATKMVTWNHPGDSVYGMAARSRRMVDTMEDLLGGEVGTPTWLRASVLGRADGSLRAAHGPFQFSQ